ncbi:GtrA family protein [bacterium]|nr:GtrA family protein [bacterium]
MGKMFVFIKKVLKYDIVKFVTVGGFGVITDMVVFSSLLYFFDLSRANSPFVVAWILPVFGFSLAVIQNYLFNHYWTFSERVKGISISFHKFVIFFGVAAFTALIPRMLAYQVVLGLFADETSKIAIILSNFVAIIAGTLFNYFGTKYFVFKPKGEQ